MGGMTPPGSSCVGRRKEQITQTKGGGWHARRTCVSRGEEGEELLKEANTGGQGKKGGHHGKKGGGTVLALRSGVTIGRGKKMGMHVAKRKLRKRAGNEGGKPRLSKKVFLRGEGAQMSPPRTRRRKRGRLSSTKEDFIISYGRGETELFGGDYQGRIYQIDGAQRRNKGVENSVRHLYQSSEKKKGREIWVQIRERGAGRPGAKVGGGEREKNSAMGPTDVCQKKKKSRTPKIRKKGGRGTEFQDFGTDPHKREATQLSVGVKTVKKKKGRKARFSREVSEGDRGGEWGCGFTRKNSKASPPGEKKQRGGKRAISRGGDTPRKRRKTKRRSSQCGEDTGILDRLGSQRKKRDQRRPLKLGGRSKEGKGEQALREKKKRQGGIRGQCSRGLACKRRGGK